jgi:Flp pilus assembly secretin CpaC
LLIVFVCVVAVANATQAQTVNGQPISGLQSGRPIVPTMQPRQGISELERQNLTNRPSDDGESVAGLLQSVKGDDSTLEIIVGRGRLLTLNEAMAAAEGETPSIAVGDPTVLDFDVLPNSRIIRLLGKRVGMTDLSIVTGNGKSYNFEIQVVYDLNLLRAYLKQLYPDAALKIAQMYEHVVVEGEAPSVDQSNQIIQTVQAFLASAQVARSVQTTDSAGTPNTRPDYEQPATPADQRPKIAPADGEGESKPNTTVSLPEPRIINLIRIPGVQQIMLQVRIAELNRTALRRAGTDWLYRDSSGRTFGSRLGSSTTTTGTTAGGDPGFLGLALPSPSFQTRPSLWLWNTSEPTKSSIFSPNQP